MRRFAHPLGGFALIFRDPYLLLAAALVVLLNCVNSTGEYILAELVVGHVDQQLALDPSLDKGVLIAQFYGEFFFAVNALTVLAQLFLVARVFRWVGVQGALLVLPVVALLGYVFVAFVPIFAILRVIKVIENAADYSVTNTARQALYLPLPTEAKYQGKITTDTFFWRFGDLLQGAIVFAGLNWFGFEVRHFAALNLLLAAVWLAVAVQLAKRYSARTATRVHPPRIVVALCVPGAPSLCARAARGVGAWRRGGRDCVVRRHSGHDEVDSRRRGCPGGSLDAGQRLRLQEAYAKLRPGRKRTLLLSIGSRSCEVPR